MAETWDESKPAGSRAPTLGDDDIREFKRAMRERLAEEHQFQASESPAFGAAGGYKIGKHKYVTLIAQATAKTTASDEVAMRSKDVSGNIELILTPASAGTDRQLTKNAGKNLNLQTGDFENYLIKAGMYDSGSIDGDDIAALGIKTANINTYAVGASQLDTGSVTSDKITDGALSIAKLVPEVAGDNNYYPEGKFGGTAFAQSNADYPGYVTRATVCFRFPGTLRFYTGYWLSDSYPTGYYRIRKNGGGLLSWTKGSTGWAYRTDDIAVVAGDYLTWEMCVNPGNSVYYVNMLIYMRGAYRTMPHNWY